MSKRLKVNLAKYGFCALFVALLAWAYISLRDFAGAELVEQYRMLADAFTLPGILLIMFGAMAWVASEGALDGIAYCLRMAFFALIPGKRLERDEKYGDYVERKRANRTKGFGFLFIAGSVTMVVAIVFIALFYSVYQG